LFDVRRDSKVRCDAKTIRTDASLKAVIDVIDTVSVGRKKLSPFAQIDLPTYCTTINATGSVQT
jgi:hypothetical protein